MGQSYTVLTDSAQSGRFATVTGQGYNVVYDPTDVKLVATAPPPPPNPQPNPNPNPQPNPNPRPNQVPAASVDSPSLRNPGSGDGTLMFTITLSTSAGVPASVQYATANATASTPGDYTALSGTVNFAAGETRKTVSVTVHGKPNPGPDRKLFLNLSRPSNATIAVGRGTGTVLNDRVSLANVLPSHLGTGLSETITLRGAGFTGSPTVRLTHPGLPDIVATNVSVGRDGRTLSAVFDLSKASLGVRDVVVTLPSFDASAALRDAITIEKSTPAYVEAQLTGPGQAAADYPYTSFLHFVNRGNTDAVHTLVRVDGFQSRAKVEVRGPGLSVTDLDSGDEHGVLVAVDRVPALSSSTAVLRFTPIGPGHSHYHLRVSVVEDSVAAANTGPPSDPTLGVKQEVRSHSATDERGIFHVSGAFGSGDLNYEVRISPGAPPVPSTLTESHTADRVRYAFTGYLPRAPTSPPGTRGRGLIQARPRAVAVAAEADGLTGRISVTLDGKKKLDDALKVAKDAYGTYRVTVDRRTITDCLLAQGHIDQIQHDALIRFANGGQTLKLMDTALGKSGLANSIVTSEFSVLTGIAYDSWESGLIGGGFSSGYLATGQLDITKTNPFVGLDRKQKLAAVFELCLPKPPPPPPPPPPPTPPQQPPTPPQQFLPSPAPYYHVKDIDVITPGDPNEKTGPQGYGKRHYVSPATPLPYDVMFENKPTATAPAHEITVTDQLDPRKVDLSTLALGALYFGDTVASPPPRSQTWTDTVDLRPAKNLIVSIDANLDRVTALLTWKLRGLDPDTGQLATGPTDGFLPPDTMAPMGRGGVSFTVMPASGLSTNDQILNAATIIFDHNAPIVTSTYINTIDVSAPSSRVVSARLARRSCKNLHVGWGGSDTGAGVASFDAYAARNGGAYKRWRLHTARRSGTYRIAGPGTYTFYSLATDGVGHPQAATRHPALKVALKCRGRHCTATATTADWNQLVTSVATRGHGQVIRLNRALAARLHITSLRLLLNGHQRVTTRGLPARIILRRSPAGKSTITLIAQGLRGTVHAQRTTSACVQAPAARRR